MVRTVGANLKGTHFQYGLPVASLHRTRNTAPLQPPPEYCNRSKLPTRLVSRITASSRVMSSSRPAMRKSLYQIVQPLRLYLPLSVSVTVCCWRVAASRLT